MTTKTEKPEPKLTVEQIEEAVVLVAAGAKKLLGSRLTERAVTLLIHDAIPANLRPTRAQIATVLTTAADLEKRYLKKKP